MPDHIFEEHTEYTTEQIDSIAKEHDSSSEIISPLLATTIEDVTYVFSMAGGDVIWRYSHAWTSVPLSSDAIPHISFGRETNDA